MTLHAPMVVLLTLLSWVHSDPVRELSAWSVLRGVPVAVTLAVHETETGNVPERRRNAVISSGNVGRMQINATTWCPVLGLCRDECIEALQDRSHNIRVGTAVLARVQAKYAPGLGLAHVDGCLCGRPHAGGWVAHYNGGTVVRPGTRSERYGLKVIGKVRRMMRHQAAGASL